ncbi:hypothetical protein ACFW9I_02865 [[Kitasatospora] papulosa]|uniref:hypothetical protein n=1 Tax=[Kitasatospora] papulosa TaxID=1464011 RepID=UPI00367AD0EB
MAQWNLSVELRGQGNDLAKKLRKAAADARTLAAAAGDAQTEVRQLGTTSATTGKSVKKLGTAAETSTARLLAMGAEAKSAAKDLRKLERALASTDAQIRAMADHVRITAELDDQTEAGVATIRAALADLQALSPIDLNATIDDHTEAGAATVRAAVADLRSLSPISLNATLDDQTTTGIAGVTTSLTSLQALSPLSLRATLDDDTGSGVAAVTTALAELRALSPVDITARFDGDTTQIAAAATAMGELRDHADNANTALTALTTQAAAVAAALNQIQQEAQDASRALRTLRGRAAAAAAALDELGDRARHAARGLNTLSGRADSAGTRLNTLGEHTRTLRGNLDDLDGSLTRVTGRMGGLRGSLGSVGSSANDASRGTGNLIQAAIALGTALIPIAAATVPIAAGLGAAGVAVGAFGLAIGGQIMALTEAAEAEDKYDKAVREHGAASEQAAKAETEYLRQLAEMPPASRESAAALAALKDEYKDWSDALADDTMPVVTKSLQLFSAALPKFTPLVQGASGELDHFLNVAAGGMRTPGFDRFMATFTRFATESLARGTHALVRFTEAMDTGEIGADLREFLDYARANGPLVGETLGNLASAVTHLLVAMSDMGVSVLGVVNAFAQLVTAIPTGLLSTMLQLYAGFKLITLGAAALGAVTGSAAVARLGAYFAIMRAAGVSTTLRATAASMSAMTKASIGLGVLAVAAVGVSKLAEKARGAPPDVDRLTTSLKNLAETGKLTGELKDTFGDLHGLVTKIGEVGKASKESEEYVKSFGDGSVGPLEDLRKGAYNLWSDFTKGEKSFKALKDDFSSMDDALSGMVSSGYGDQAATDFAMIETAARNAGHSTKEVAELFPEYKAAVAAAAAEQQLAASGMGLFGQQAIATKEKLDAQKASADGLRQSIVALNETNRSALGGMIGFEASIDAATKAAKENAGSLNMVNGQLDVNSPKAQAAATALADLGQKTDEAAAAARASGQPWEDVNAIYERGRKQLVANAQQMGLTKAEAQALAVSILGIPSDHSTNIEMIREDAIAGLDQVIQKIEATPDAKTVTVDALTAEATQMLNSLGYKTKTLPDGRVEVTARTGGALSGLRAVKSARDSLSDKTITITTHYRITGSGAAQEARRSGSHGTQLAQANGGVVDYYANGGIRGAQYFAQGGSTSPDTKNGHVAHIAKAGTWRVFAEDETGGESYVPLHPSKRTRSRAITEETVRRLGGDPSMIQWNADGGITDWRYDPNTGSLYSPTDAGSAGNKTKKVTTKGKNGKKTTKEVAYFDLSAVEKKLKSASAATRTWNRDLEKVADRVGGDVAEALAAMGKDGVALTKKMANGSTKYINEMAAALRGLAAEAKASLADYTRELNKATTADSAFSKNLATLAARGYGDLAKQLAAQGDEAAAQLAASAVGDNKKASAANTAAKKANSALTKDQVQDLVAIIAAVKTSKTGLHDVADTTGIGEDDIVTIASKAKAQISSSLGSRAAKFLADLGRAEKGLSYANGGIRSGIYATHGGAVTFAEPETGGEAFIPLGASKRRQATNVLRDVAGRFGVGLTDMAATRQIVVVREGGDTHVNVTTVRTGASASDIGTQVGRQMRRVRRGGVNARA